MLQTHKKQQKYRDKYHLSIEQLSNIFGYSSSASFRNSSALNRHLLAVERIIEIVEERIKVKLFE